MHMHFHIMLLMNVLSYFSGHIPSRPSIKKYFHQLDLLESMFLLDQNDLNRKHEPINIFATPSNCILTILIKQ